ncbi:LysR family transcriptional regulator [Streptomyces syringium]|uniref:LysR family transcriptional regulator n=1 Tax=Streptomyces syringium TaxID=76729 RepID=UPI0033B36775
MRVEQLEYLAAVTRLGSLRRAAEELHMSQPALGETLRKLERELGVELLERKRSGAKISLEGQDLLPHIAAVLDAVDRLREAADTQHRTSRTLRLGTVNAATVTVLTPAIREFRTTHPKIRVEVVADRHDGIQQHVVEGAFDLGIVSYLRDDDLPPGLHTTELLRGRPVVCIRKDSPLTAHKAITVTDLLSCPLITMRAGYVMHRYLHRLLSGSTPSFSYTADGTEMSKLMVAEGLGVSVLPDYSVHGDPLERSGAITYRPLSDDNTEFRVMLQRRYTHATRTPAQDLHAALIRQAGKQRIRPPR